MTIETTTKATSWWSRATTYLSSTEDKSYAEAAAVHTVNTITESSQAAWFGLKTVAYIGKYVLNVAYNGLSHSLTDNNTNALSSAMSNGAEAASHLAKAVYHAAGIVTDAVIGTGEVLAATGALLLDTYNVGNIDTATETASDNTSWVSIEKDMSTHDGAPMTEMTEMKNNAVVADMFDPPETNTVGDTANDAA